MSLSLLDYRRRVAGAYAAVRASNQPEAAATAFRNQRDELFRTHPQSALDEVQKRRFAGLSYVPYDPRFRVTAELERATEPLTLALSGGADGKVPLERIGRVTVSLPTGTGTLDVFWIGGYGGGVFLPVADATNRVSTYGGGRYLLDTIKGADLGSQGSRLVLDFNFAYNPSCAYNPRWVCPLAPAGNRLAFAVPVGELNFDHTPEEV